MAHVAVMRAARPGMMEYELEATFLYDIYKNGGCRRAAYTSIWYSNSLQNNAAVNA